MKSISSNAWYSGSFGNDLEIESIGTITYWGILKTLPLVELGKYIENISHWKEEEKKRRSLKNNDISKQFSNCRESFYFL